MEHAKLTRRALFVPAFLGGQALLVKWAADGERAPKTPDLSKLPEWIGGWRKIQEVPIDPEVNAQLRADRLLQRTYMRQQDGVLADLFLAWFKSQRDGASQPHSPQVCLPGNGWVPVASETLALETDAGRISVNKYVTIHGAQRAVTLYWYQTPRRVIASEWAAKFWIVPDAFRDHRTDTALVRIFLWNASRSDQATTNAGNELARLTYPLLREILPR